MRVIVDVLYFLCKNFISKCKFYPSSWMRILYYGKQRDVIWNFTQKKFTLGDIHKPRGQLRGSSQMTILLHKPYLVKVTTGVQKRPKFWTLGLLILIYVHRYNANFTAIFKHYIQNPIVKNLALFSPTVW